MLKFKILSVGKTKELWLEEAIHEYIKRLKGQATVEFVWAKDDAQLTEMHQKEPSCLALDPRGKLMTSEEFSSFIHSKLMEKGARLTFIIGGAEGLPSSVKQACDLISLSPLTFTHQMTRLILVEQLYRALEIQKGSRYHK